MSDKLATLQLLAVQAAEEFWKQDIIDPSSKDTSEIASRSRTFIDGIIRSDEGLGWNWEQKYLGDGDFAWCGAFVAACYSKAGLALDIRKKHFASTYRLDRYATYRGLEGQTMYDEKVRGYSKCETVDAIKEFAPRPGDIGLVGEKGYGTHIVLIAEILDLNADNMSFRTTEGNGFGEGPDKKKREGVIHKSRPWTSFRRIIRPALIDFDSV